MKDKSKMYMLLTGLLIIGVIVTTCTSCSKNNTSTTNNRVITSPNNQLDLAGTWVNTTNSGDYFVMRDTINNQYSIYAGTFINNYDNVGSYPGVLYPVVFSKSILTTAPGFSGINFYYNCTSNIINYGIRVLYENPYIIISIPAVTLNCINNPQQTTTYPPKTITFMKY